MEFSLQDELTLLSNGEEYEFDNQLDLDDRDSIQNSINGQSTRRRREEREGRGKG